MQVPNSFKRRARVLKSVDDAISIKLQSENTNESYFSWNVTDFNENGMNIQLNFTDASSVSSVSPDVLIVQIVDPSFFIDYDGHLLS